MRDDRELVGGEIVPGVHRVPGIRGSNVFLLVDEALAVVDTGTVDNTPAIADYIRSLGREPTELRWIVLTHQDMDHAGSAAALREETGAQVVAHREETESGEDGALRLRRRMPRRATGFESWLMRTFVWRGGGGAALPPMADTEIDLAVDDGRTLPLLGGLKLWHTPGHSPGHLCPYLPQQGALFAGDAILNNVDRLSRPLMWERAARRELDATLRRLGELEVSSLFCAHGPPLTENAGEAVRRLTARPYDLPTWRIVLRNRRTLSAFRRSTQGPGHWMGGPRSG